MNGEGGKTARELHTKMRMRQAKKVSIGSPCKDPSTGCFTCELRMLVAPSAASEDFDVRPSKAEQSPRGESCSHHLTTHAHPVLQGNICSLRDHALPSHPAAATKNTSQISIRKSSAKAVSWIVGGFCVHFFTLTLGNTRRGLQTTGEAM